MRNEYLTETFESSCNTPHPNPLPFKGRGDIVIGDRDLPKNHSLYACLIQAIEHGEPEEVERQFGAARLENLWMP